MSAARPFRYFLVVYLHTSYGLVILVALVAVGLWTIALSPAELDGPLGMLLLVQMFLASSGFTERARRGHFDPLLTFPSDRTRALIAHWAVSVTPGVVAWIVLSVVAYALGSPAAGSALAGTRAAALFIVSCLAWAAGFALPRGAAGFLWFAVVFAALLRYTNLAASSSPVVLVLCPFVLMRPGSIDPAAVAAAILMAVVPLLCVWRHGRRLDLYLLERA